jgi:hypothetical protein
MKKILLLLFVLLSTYSYGFADTQTFRQEIIQSQAFKGQVESIILPDPSQGIKHKIVVINSQGQRMNFVLTSGISVYDQAWEPFTLKRIKPGDKVLVEYAISKKDGSNRVISIMVMSD